jgi:hypothetical protein
MILQFRQVHQYEPFEDAAKDAATDADAEAAAAEAAAKEQQARIQQLYTQLENLSKQDLAWGNMYVAIYNNMLKDFDKVFQMNSVQTIMAQLKLVDLKKILGILIPKFLEDMHDDYDDLCLLTTETKFLYVKMKTETNDLSDLDLPADELKRLTEDRKQKALQRYTDDKVRYSKQNGDKPVMECFANPENTDNKDKPEDDDMTDEEKAAAAAKQKAAADKAAADKSAKLAAAKLQAKHAPPKDAIEEKDVDAYIAIINETMRSDQILEAKTKHAMIEATLGFNARYFKKIADLKPKSPPPKKEGFANPVVEGFQTVSRAKFLALKLLKSLKPLMDLLETHYDLQKKVALQKDELKKVKQLLEV